MHVLYKVQVIYPFSMVKNQLEPFHTHHLHTSSPPMLPASAPPDTSTALKDGRAYYISH